MDDNSKEQADLTPEIDDNDLWVRGAVYSRYKHALFEAEANVEGLELDVARRQYEHEIAQRIRDKATDAEAREEWESLVSAAHDCVQVAENDLAEAVKRAAYHQAMLAEIAADLGDLAGVYALILPDLPWDEDKDYYEPDLEDLCPFIDACPFLSDEEFAYEFYDDEMTEFEEDVDDASDEEEIPT